MKNTNKYKLAIIFRLSLITLILIILNCCGSSKKAATTITEKNLEVKSNMIYDPGTKKFWKFYYDNPTSFIRYMMVKKEQGWRIPEYNELSEFFQKLSSQYLEHRTGGLRKIDWFEKSGTFLSITKIKTWEGEDLYGVIYWNAETKEFKSESATNGDLVNIILVESK